MKIIIAGSRNFTDYERFRNDAVGTLNNIINGNMELLKDIEIVSGGAEGTDKMAEKLAAEYGLAIKVIPANWDELGKTAGFTRNKEMALYAKQDTQGAMLLAFWNGESSGTQHMMTLANTANIPVTLFNVKMALMQEIEQDILTVTSGVICQQVNCRGVMGSGIAASIRAKWPVVYDSYASVCKDARPDRLLGNMNIVEVGTGLYVCNLFGQLTYGRDPIIYTDYEALYSALIQLRDSCKGMHIYFPHRIGCGLANGNWDRVKKIIEYVFRYADNEITVCKH